MIKKILTYSFGEVLVKSLSFLAIPLYSYMILPSEYGTLGFLNALISFLPFIFTFYYLYGYVRFSVEVEDETLISSYLFMGLLLNLFYIFGAIAFFYLFIEQYEIELKYFILSILASSSIYIFQILQMHYRSKGYAKAYVKFSLFYALLGLSLNFIFLIIFTDNVFAMLLSSFVTSLVASLLALNILRNYFSFNKIDKKVIITILKYTLPLVPGAIALLLFSQSDKLVLVQYVTKEALGIYTVAFTLGLSMGYIGSAFFMGYQPIFYDKIKNGLNREIEKQFMKNIFLILAALVLSWIVIYTIYHFIDIKYRSGLSSALIIAVSYSMITFAQMMELHLTYIKRSFLVSLVYGFGGVVTVGFLFYLVPSFGGLGASYSLFLGALAISFMMYFVAQKYFYLNYNLLAYLFFYAVIFTLIGTLYVFQ